jgi:hypothetical protein
MLVNDAAPYIEVKKARIARSGKQLYSASELQARKVSMRTAKDTYVEYRPPEVLLKHKEKFQNIVFVNDHAPVDVTPDNWKEYAIGFVGSNVGIEVINDEVWITNDVIFFDRKAYDDYKAGKVELSASYDAKFVVVEDAATVGYDTVMVDIPAVNHVALCYRARAGHNARILDSIDSMYGGITMKKGFLSSLFGIGKINDAAPFSSVLMDSLGKVKADATCVEQEIARITEYVAKLGDSEAKEVLAGAVADCYKNLEAVLARKDEVGKKLDELYCTCQDADTAAVQRILKGTSTVRDTDDKDKGKASDDPEDKKKEAATDTQDNATKNNDSASMNAVVEAAVEKAFAKVHDSIDAKIDAAMKKALGVADKIDAKKSGTTTQVQDSVLDEDASFLVRGVFGAR